MSRDSSSSKLICYRLYSQDSNPGSWRTFPLEQHILTVLQSTQPIIQYVTEDCTYLDKEAEA
jgi:hypothetical protein